MDFVRYVEYGREDGGVGGMNLWMVKWRGMGGRWGELVWGEGVVDGFVEKEKGGMEGVEKVEGNVGKDRVVVNEWVGVYGGDKDLKELVEGCKKKGMSGGNEM